MKHMLGVMLRSGELAEQMLMREYLMRMKEKRENENGNGVESMAIS